MSSIEKKGSVTLVAFMNGQPVKAYEVPPHVKGYFIIMDHIRDPKWEEKRKKSVK